MLLPIPLGPSRQTVSPAAIRRSKSLQHRMCHLVAEGNLFEAHLVAQPRRPYCVGPIDNRLVAVEHLPDPSRARPGLGQYCGQPGQPANG